MSRLHRTGLTLYRENAGGKEMAMGVSREVRSLKGFMKPVMKEWLTTGLGKSFHMFAAQRRPWADKTSYG